MNQDQTPKTDQSPARPPLPPKPPMTDEQRAYFKACGQRAAGMKKKYTKKQIAVLTQRLKKGREEKRWPAKDKTVPNSQ